MKQIGSITLIRRLPHRLAEAADGCFLTKHTISGLNSWEKVVDHFGDIVKVLLTATPARTDGKGLGKHADTMIMGPSIQELVAMGALAKCQTYTFPADFDRNRFKVIGGDFSKGDLAKVDDTRVIASVVRNFENLIRDRRTIVFNMGVAASVHMAERFRSLGYRAEHVDGETEPGERVKIFKRFHAGQTQILSNVMLATEGIDVPECDAVIVARPTKSMVLWKQMCGRPMRPKADGRDMVVVDVADNVYWLGDPDADVEWSLDDGVVPSSIAQARTDRRSYMRPMRPAGIGV